jgi:hypothetical protein
MTSMVWVLGKTRSPCRLFFDSQAKRDLHDIYGLSFRPSAVSMVFMLWFLGKRDLHDACDLSFKQARFSCCLCLGLQTNRGLHDVYGLDFGQVRYS